MASRSWWQQYINTTIIESLPQQKGQNIKLKSQVLQRFQGPGGWLGIAALTIAMLIWNWKLLLATAIGAIVMSVVYVMHEWDWNALVADMRNSLNTPHRQFTLAAISGGVATVSTYMSASIWLDADSHWIAAGAILQGLGTLTVLILLVWQILGWQANHQESQLEQLLKDLSSTDSLKRLIAVRRLPRAIKRTRQEVYSPSAVAEYLQLLLIREQESVIREAAFDSLQVLAPAEQQPLDKLPALKRPKVATKQKVEA
ncbi:hypothetical protein [Aliterella atlantica]|uniref:hypothetical protein n=1 Tax=Aliterella atlantica TaxID=1827278 RepID=UPI001184ED0D|nr:hypothetical protein [Aliterella atlantica]